MRWIGSAVTVLALAAPSGPQPISTLDGRTLSSNVIHAELERARRAADATGIAVALIRDGQVVDLETDGVRDKVSGAPLTPDTVMRGASLTKAVFAYLVMQLVDEGRVDLDRPISAYLPRPLPDYPGYTDLASDPRWRALTFRILLDHTSGFANYRSFEDDGRLRFHRSPGARYGYSGEGINLAQFVLENGLHLDLAGEMKRRVFDRFGMSRSSLTWPASSPDDVATGYDEKGAPIAYAHISAPRAASSLLTTPYDYARFLAGVVRGDGLSAASRTAMTRLQIAIDSRTQFPTFAPARTGAYRHIRLGYGLGWGVFDTPYGHAFFKEGHDDGVANYALCVPIQRACILLMSNDSRAESVFKLLADELLGPTNLPWRWEGYDPPPLSPTIRAKLLRSTPPPARQPR